MCMQNFITIVHSVRPFSLFQNLELGTASTNVKCHFAISWGKFGNPSLDHTNSNVYAKCYQSIPNGSRGRASFIFFFRIWISAKPRPMPNVIWQSHGVHLVHINLYAKCHNNIPLSSRDRVFFTFFFRIWSSAKPRPMKNVISQSLGLDLVNINVYAKVYQNIPLGSRDRAIFTFSEFGARQSLDRW